DPTMHGVDWKKTRDQYARMLEDAANREDVKIINKPGVKPVEMARPDEIDSSKYMEFMESTLDQITSSMDLDFDSIVGKPKQMGLDQFFWN
ncbi:MAG: hypothetical protein HYZ56_06435, partial [Nitrosopumilales archaeon]|nr:hypothetical protein [Nitrosopumilales archaeon]